MNYKLRQAFSYHPDKFTKIQIIEIETKTDHLLFTNIITSMISILPYFVNLYGVHEQCSCFGMCCDFLQVNLIRSGLVMPRGDIDRGQNWLM